MNNIHINEAFIVVVLNINCNHNLDFALAIRTMMIDEQYINVEAGCGVVYDSIPEKELNETKLKAKSLLEVRP